MRIVEIHRLPAFPMETINSVSEIARGHEPEIPRRDNNDDVDDGILLNGSRARTRRSSASGSLAIGLSKMSDGSCSDATGEVPHNFLMDITEACSSRSCKGVYTRYETIRREFKRCSGSLGI